MTVNLQRIFSVVICAAVAYAPVFIAEAKERTAAIITLKNGQVIDIDILDKTDETIDVVFPSGEVARYMIKDIASIGGENYKRNSPEYGRLLVEAFNQQTTTVPILNPDISRQTAVDTDDPQTAFERAQPLADAGDFQGAAAYLTVAIKGKYQPWDSYYQRANAYYNLQDFTRAAADFSELIKLEPDDYVGYSSRGECWLKLNRFQEAIADFDQAIRRKPDDEYAFANRGMAYFHQGKHAEALADLDKSIALAPDQAALNYSNRAVIHLSKKEYARAVDDLTKAIEGMPEIPGFYANRSAAYFYMKEFQKSYDDMLMAEKLGIPRNPQLELQLIKELYQTHFKK